MILEALTITGFFNFHFIAFYPLGAIRMGAKKGANGTAARLLSTA